MKKTVFYLILLYHMSILASCQNSIEIHPIDEYRNNAIVEDSSNSLSADFLYFEVSNFKKLSPELLAKKIYDYLKTTGIEKKLIHKNNEVYCYFYQKKTLKNYKKLLGDQEQISDSGSFFDEGDNLVALVIYKDNQLKREKNIIIYNLNGKTTNNVFDEKLLLKK